ncbi:MAG TPA: GIY-YIG nuclease family protein [Candidatus Dormibacteraeota bacterium]|nr:GIY-YIG nuclease family protein [Candidatus Dormibacteraeota bacterium]
MKKTNSYYVYILLCDNGSYYTGYSNSPTHRLADHLKGKGAKYTRMHRPRKIVYLQRHRTRRAAMMGEHRIKTLTHEGKRRLIENAT